MGNFKYDNWVIAEDFYCSDEETLWYFFKLNFARIYIEHNDLTPVRSDLVTLN